MDFPLNEKGSLSTVLCRRMAVSFAALRGMVWKGVPAEERTPGRSKPEAIRTSKRGGSGHEENGQPVADLGGESEGLANGVRVRGCFSFRRAEIFLRREGVFISLIRLLVVGSSRFLLKMQDKWKVLIKSIRSF